MDYKIPPRLVRSSMGFSIFTELLDRYHNIILKHCYHPKRTPVAVIKPLPIPAPSFCSPEWPIVYFLSIDFPILDISHTWTHEVCGLFCDWPLSLSRLPRLTHVVACVDVGCIFICEAWHPNHRHTEQNPFAYKKAKD